MPKALKIVLLIVLLVFLLVAGALSYILFAIDPNDYKPQLEAAAQKQGITLEIEGDLGWTLLPGLGLEIRGVTLSSEAHNIRSSTLGSARLNLAWLPLLQKHVVIDALAVNGADIHLDQADPANVAAVPAAAVDAPREKSGLPFSLAVKRLELGDSRITLYNPEAPAMVINGIHLTGEDLNSRGSSFPLDLRFQYPVGEKIAEISADGEITYSGEEQRVRADGLSVEVADLLAEPIRVTLNGFADLRQGTAEISSLQGDLGGIRLEGNLGATDIDSEMRFSGQFALASANLRTSLGKLAGRDLVTSDPDVLKSLNVEASFTGTPEAVTLQDLVLVLDDTRIEGAGTFGLTTPRTLELTLAGDSLNVDRYLAPAAEETAADGESEAVEGGDALLAPLAGAAAFMDGGSGSIAITFEQLTLANSVVFNPETMLAIEGDRVRLDPMRFGIYDGKASTTLEVNLAAVPAHTNFTLALSDIDIARALQQLTGKAELSGTLTMNTRGQTRGDTADQMFDQLSASGDLVAEGLHLTSVNVEQSYCEIAQLVERNPPREQPWPQGTDLDSLAAQFTVEGRILYLENYVTGIGNLKVRGQGTVDLAKEAFDIDVIANLQGDRTSESGCAIKSKRIRNRDIPLVCKDSFADAGPKSCQPDRDFVEDALKGEVLDRLLPERKDGEEEKPLEGLLRGLLNR